MVRGIAVILLSLAVLAPLRSEACSCEPGRPACQNLFAYTVFIGAVVSADDESTLFDVKETLNSDTPLEKQVRVRSGRHAPCGVGFEAGGTYVVYAHRRDGALHTSLCTPTHELHEDDEDVELARSQTTRSRARIRGWVALVVGGQWSSPPRLTVRALNEMKREFRTTTDKDGHFTLSLSPGKYTLVVDHPLLKVLTKDELQLSLPAPKACAEPHLQVAWNGRISGRVTERGKPVAGLEVEPARANEETPYPETTAFTDADGKYLLEALPPGSFRVGVSLDEGTSAESPYAETWAPGVATLRTGGLVENFNIALPPRQRVFTVRGRVRDAAGAPLPELQVSAGDRLLSTDTRGEFSFQELAGARVDVSACVRKQCPQQPCVDVSCEEKHVRVDGDTSVTLTLK